MTTRIPRALVLACAMAAAAAMTAFGAGLESRSQAGGSYADVAPVRLAAMRKDFFLVNTHVPYAGEVAGTDAFIPYSETASRLKEYPADNRAKIVVYCRSGRMSEIAARVLALAGYTNVINLRGGMIAWEEAGFSLLQKAARK